MRLQHGDDVLEGKADGDGPVDAAYKAIALAVGISSKILRYEIQAVTEGTDALGKVTVQMEDDRGKVLGKGASTDIIEASIKAYLDGLNKLTSIAGPGVPV